MAALLDRSTEEQCEGTLKVEAEVDEDGSAKSSFRRMIATVTMDRPR